MPKSSARSKTLKKSPFKPSAQNFIRPQSDSPTPAFKIFMMTLVLAAGLLGLAKAFRLHLFQDVKQKLQLAAETEVAGTLHFTALRPDPEDKGEVSLYVRELGTEVWGKTDTMIPLQQDGKWSWDEALPGEVYELQAVLTIDGKEITRSEVVQATAPTYSTELPLHVTWKDLPDDVVAVSTTKLGGAVTINGYIPATAVLELYALAPQHYQPELYQITPEVLRAATLLATVAHPTTSNFWLWEEAKPLQQYQVVAVLKQGTSLIGVADHILEADASETELEQVINSMAVPPVSAANPPTVLGVTAEDITTTIAQATNPGVTELTSISGLVTLEGPKDKDTSLLMLWKTPGQTNYQVVNRYMYPAHAGTAWQWNQAKVGQRYEITAALQVDGNNTSTAPNPITVTAPATKVNFDLNTYYVIPRTSGTPVHEVCVDADGSSATAIIRLPKIDKAAQYWVQVGGNPGESGIYNQKFAAPDNGDAKIRVRVDKAKQRFVKYSYATCIHCQSDHNFAPFSTEVGFTCD